MTMIDYIMKVKATADSLVAIREPVFDQDQVMNLLGGLGSDYNAVVTAINIRDDKISIEAVHSMLLAFEHHLEQQSSIEQISTMTANYASSSSNRGGGRTYTGSRSQHYTPNFSNYRGRSRGGRFRQIGRYNSNNSEKPQCQLCGKFGHTAQACYHRFGISYQSPQSSGNSSLIPSNQTSIPAMVASSNTVADDTWYLDSDASHHLTQNGDNLTESSPYNGKDKITIGNGKHLSISNTSSTCLFSNSHAFQLKKVFHVPFISANIISVAKFCSDNNALIEFWSNSFFVKDLHTKKVLARGRLENGLYRFPVLKNKKLAYVGVHKPSAFHSYNCRPVDNKVVLWHHRLGHVTSEIVTKVLQKCNISCGKNKATVCSSCQLAKSRRLPTHLSSSRASKPLELVHTDIWGPASVKATSGAKYFILFLDDYSRYTWFYPLHTKDQALSTFKQFKLQVENQFDTKIKCIQSDNGGEFKCFMTFLQQSGILHRFSCPYNSAQNGRVERKHRHVVETGLALLAHASLPMPFWQYAFQTATFLINRMPSQVLTHASPYFTLFHKEPDYRFLKVFGCLCYPFIRPYNNHKLQYRSVQCTFLGYSFNHKGYLCLDSVTGRVYITSHVVFDEHKFPLAKSSPSTNAISNEVFPPAIITASIPSPTCSYDHPAPPSSTLPDISTSSHSTSGFELTPDSSNDSSILPELFHTTPPSSSFPVPCMTTRLMRGITKKKSIFDLSAVKVSEPTTLKQALIDPHWTHAMDLEMAALHHNKTWDLVQQPSDVNVIGCKWVYKLKHKADGSIDRYNARLVAKGYNQTHGLDYFKTFSPVVKTATIRKVNFI